MDSKMAAEVRKPDIGTHCLEALLTLFLGNSDESVVAFPNALTPNERGYVVSRVSSLNDVSFDIQRRREIDCLTLRKSPRDLLHFSLSNTSRESVLSLMKISDNEIDITPSIRRKPSNSNNGTSNIKCDRLFQHQSENPDEEPATVNNAGSGNRLHINFPPLIPPHRVSDDLAHHRQGLSIWKYKDEILQSVHSQKVTIIMGRSGTGKSTQVPQFIMDAAAEDGTPTKILCCHPHRVSAIVASSCVARERGERVGVSVGYQARLESCYSPCSSILIYSTSELFLRSLIPPTYPIFNNLTYVILDDFHLRNTETDFALTCLLNLLPVFQFRLILLCGDMDSRALLAYFRKFGVPDPKYIYVEQNIPEKPPVIYHLSDVKKLLKDQLLEHEAITALQSVGSTSEFRSPTDTEQRCKCCDLPRGGHLVNCLLHRYLFLEDNDAAEEFTDLVLRQEVDIHGRHQATGLDFAAAAALKGEMSLLCRFLSMGANVFRPLKHGYDAVLLLDEFRQAEISNYINTIRCLEPFVQNVTYISPVNLVLIMEIIQYIHLSAPLEETILVYVSSYDEIIALKDTLFDGSKHRLNLSSFFVCILHLNIPCGDEKVIFELAPKSVRKIILTTDVADTVTVKDVVHVIDAGYTEEKTYNGKNSAIDSRKVLISKAAAVERVRSTTYRLYELKTFKKMTPFRAPEIERRPLQELSLYSASLLKNSKSTADFFAQFFTPPKSCSLNRSFDELISIGALDKNHKLTRLGCYLLDFPVKPCHAKALIYATILRCLDPVLTIVAVMSHRDPFKTPADPRAQVEIQKRKEQLSKQAFSDHMTILQAFLDWEKYCGKDIGVETLRLNHVAPGIFDMICAIRTDLLGQLRAFGFVRCKGVGNIKDLNTNSHNWSVVKAALIAALYPNVMQINRRTWSLNNAEFELARLHPLCCMARDPLRPTELPPAWAIYEEVNEFAGMNLSKGCTLVSTFSLLVFGGSPYCAPETEDIVDTFGVKPIICKAKVNDWIELEGLKIEIGMVLAIRKKFQNLLLKQLRKPGSLLTAGDERDLQLIALILTTEDRAAGLAQIDGIGQWPRFAGASLLSVPCQGFTKSATASTATDSDDD